MRKKRLLYIYLPTAYSPLLSLSEFTLILSPIPFLLSFFSAERISRKQPVFAFVINQIYLRNRSVFFHHNKYRFTNVSWAAEEAAVIECERADQ